MADAPEQPKRRGRPPKKPKLDTESSSEEATTGPSNPFLNEGGSSSPQVKATRSSPGTAVGTSPVASARGHPIVSSSLQLGHIPRVAQPRSAVQKTAALRAGTGLRTQGSRLTGRDSSGEGRSSGHLSAVMAGSGESPAQMSDAEKPVDEEAGTEQADHGQALEEKESGGDLEAEEEKGYALVSTAARRNEGVLANGGALDQGENVAEEGANLEGAQASVGEDVEMEDGEGSQEAAGKDDSKAAEALMSVFREFGHGRGSAESGGSGQQGEIGNKRPGDDLEDQEVEDDAVGTVAAALAEGIAEGATAGVAEAVAKAAESESAAVKDEEASDELRVEAEGEVGAERRGEFGGRGLTMPKRRGRPAKRGRGGGRWAGIGRGRGLGSPGRGPGAQVSDSLVVPREGAPAGVAVHDRPLGKRRGRPPRQKSPPPVGGPGVAGPVEEHARQLSIVEEGVDDDRVSSVMDAVVKVFCVHTEPNFSLPWQKKRQYSSNSSGFIIKGRRVLTNAHSVEHHTMVKVKKRGSDSKFLATVLAVGTECDIALLSVEDETFWEGVVPLELGPLPRLQDGVTVAGYPIGGDTISVTSGVVSRIEVTSYVHGACELLGVQIDAAINSGNSGGPAFNNYSQCVGIAFQSLKNDDTENIGYIIPTPVIHHFIHDYERTGGYTGFPTLGWEWQKLESPDLRRFLGMAANQKGVRVRRIEPTAPAAEGLQPSDVVLSFDGVEIANDGTVPFRQGERIAFSYLVSQKYTGEKARLSVLRGGQRHEVSVSLQTHRRLIPVHIGGRLPSYYIVGGILFTPVTVPYLRSEYGKDYDFDAPVKLLEKLMHAMAEDPQEEIVVVSQVLVADVNIGYEEHMNTQVLAFNGTPVKSLRQLARLVDECAEPFMCFDLDYHQMMVLDAEAAKKSTAEILIAHSIPSAKSNDLES